MTAIEAVISDFGGVLTSPLLDSFAAFQDNSGLSLEQLGNAMMAIWHRHGENPLYELERGEITEASFMQMLGVELSAQLDRPVALHGLGERIVGRLDPNQRMIEYLRTLAGSGLKLALCTNNVREWEPLWRAKLPVDEIFDVVVDSAFVGSRKPEPRIYELTLERLGADPRTTLFIDDIDVNCDAARELGMQAVWFRDTEQAIAEIETSLGRG